MAKVHEGLVLVHRETGREILLLHGHQVDFKNSNLWRLSKFLVRYFWTPLESIGIRDRTRTAKNYKAQMKVSRRLRLWVESNRHLLVAGHNHRPSFPMPKDPLYFNTGSCVHPRCITGIEIVRGNMTLVKWSVKAGHDGLLYIGRDILAGPRRLDEM